MDSPATIATMVETRMKAIVEGNSNSAIKTENRPGKRKREEEDDKLEEKLTKAQEKAVDLEKKSAAALGSIKEGLEVAGRVDQDQSQPQSQHQLYSSCIFDYQWIEEFHLL